jgi:hypothetical protein
MCNLLASLFESALGRVAVCQEAPQDNPCTWSGETKMRKLLQQNKKAAEAAFVV